MNLTQAWNARPPLPLRSSRARYFFALTKPRVMSLIASVLRAEMRGAESRRQEPNVAEKAWDMALRGNALLYSSPSDGDYREAYQLLTRAVELDPTIAFAWSGLGLVHYDASDGDIPGVSRPNSTELAMKAARALR